MRHSTPVARWGCGRMFAASGRADAGLHQTWRAGYFRSVAAVGIMCDWLLLVDLMSAREWSTCVPLLRIDNTG